MGQIYSVVSSKQISNMKESREAAQDRTKLHGAGPT